MVAALLFRSLVLLALGLSHQAEAACTRSVTAKLGDTCATLASQAGITVTQFLRSNPSVGSCSALVVGASYCVEGTADGDPTSAQPSPSSSPGLEVSIDGNCGNGFTCAGSRYGTCCSAHGFCGSTSDYCGDGCQAAFGSCGSGGGETTPGPTATVTVTTTTGVTRTSLVYQTSTLTSVVTQTRTAATTTVTQTVRTTATVPATVTSTATSTIRLTSIVTSLSITTSTSIRTSVSTRTVVVTSLSVETSVVTSTRVVTSGACSTTPTRTTTSQVPTGRPTLPGTPSNCRQYDEIERGDSCRSLADRNNLSLLEFYQLNPSVSATVLTLGGCTPDLIELVLSGLCQINCDALWEGYYVCVGR